MCTNWCHSSYNTYKNNKAIPKQIALPDTAFCLFSKLKYNCLSVTCDWQPCTRTAVRTRPLPHWQDRDLDSTWDPPHRQTRRRTPMKTCLRRSCTRPRPLFTSQQTARPYTGPTCPHMEWEMELGNQLRRLWVAPQLALPCGRQITLACPTHLPRPRPGSASLQHSPARWWHLQMLQLLLPLPMLVRRFNEPQLHWTRTRRIWGLISTLGATSATWPSRASSRPLTKVSVSLTSCFIHTGFIITFITAIWKKYLSNL